MAAPLSSYIDAFKTLYEGSATFDAWIKTVNAGEGASTHAILGYRPRNLGDVLTLGPFALIRAENFFLSTGGSAKAFSGTIDVVVDHIWGVADFRADDDFLFELEQIDKIVGEIVSTVGINLDATFGGHIIGINAPNLIQRDPARPTTLNSEVRYVVGWGKDG